MNPSMCILYLIQPLFVVSIPHIYETIRPTRCKSTMAANFEFRDNTSSELLAQQRTFLVLNCQGISLANNHHTYHCE